MYLARENSCTPTHYLLSLLYKYSYTPKQNQRVIPVLLLFTCKFTLIADICLISSKSWSTRYSWDQMYSTLTPIVNKSCNTECCVNNMLQIIQNMMVSQCSELEPSMFRGTTLSGQHPLIYIWVQNLQKYSTPWSHWYIIISSSKP